MKTAADVEEIIRDLLLGDEASDLGLRVDTFEEAGVLTANQGLVVRTRDGREFQVSIVRSR